MLVRSRQQVVVGDASRPVGEIVAVDAVLGAAVMLQSDAALPVGERQQKIVMVVVFRAVERLRLRNEVLVILDLLVGRRERSEEHTSELQSLMRISYAVFCLKKKK